MSNDAILALLESGRSRLWNRADRGDHLALIAAMRAWPGEGVWVPADADEAPRLQLQLCAFLQHHIATTLVEIKHLHERAAEFSRRCAHAIDPSEKQQHVLDFARDLGASGRAYEADRAALRRWFGEDVMIERYQHRVGALERRISTCLFRLRTLVPKLIAQLGARRDPLELWQRFDLQATVEPLLTHVGDARVRAAAFNCLANAIQALPQALQDTAISANTARFIYRSAMDRRQQTWVQTQAVRVIESLSPKILGPLLRERLGTPGSDDDLFVRRRAVEALGRALLRAGSAAQSLEPLLDTCLADPSAFVRQGLAAVLANLDVASGLPRLKTLSADAVPQVRAAVALALLDAVGREAWRDATLALLDERLAVESDRFALRVLLHVAVEGNRRLLAAGEAPAAVWRARLLPAIERLHTGCPHLTVRRWAAQTREALWAQGDAARRAMLQSLRTQMGEVTPGDTVRMPEGLRTLDEATRGRMLARIAEDDFGAELDSELGRPVLRRWHLFGTRLWRVWHELRHPSTEKRQAFRHTIGRVFEGRIRAPSAILSELSETKVPGEPLFVAAEGGWRPYLPLVDEMLSALSHGAEPTRVHTAEGITEIVPPASAAARIRAWWTLTRHFAEFARLRNWKEGDSRPARSYVERLESLGFRLQLASHRNPDGSRTSLDPAVSRFFSFAPLSLITLKDDFTQYFVSVYQNSIRDLLLFLVGIVALFVGRHLWSNHRMRGYRRRMPLVIGGWGTRGKSGTERLKAALVNALGYNVVSKTTGCEAMFLHGHAYGQLREMFLFRPYDKATIWEQVAVMGHADALGAEVFLWECMGLTPAYVDVLQRQWMRDDLSTITNAYPDHEDIQGPAGIDVPQVIARFIPTRSKLLTSEEQMLPILAHAAREARTDLRCVGWLEAGMIAPDVLARFPYEEHPYNIALVLALADELGVSHDYAIKEMADRVVPDLGVLKAYPTATVQGRRLDFINGMSANERLGTLSNWERMGFDKHDPRTEPGVFVTGIVNNRADRVARSRVFARILVNDIQADRFVLIGTNLDGLHGYIREEWKEAMAAVSVWDQPDPQLAPQPLQVLERWARRLRVPTSAAEVALRVQGMLAGLDANLDAADIGAQWRDAGTLRSRCGARIPTAQLDALEKHLERYAREWQEYEALAARIAKLGSGRDVALDAALHEQLGRWFESRVVIVHDAHASGDAIVQRVCEQTPPGYRNRIMGLQNIKGTGLNWVYAWQAWGEAHRLCEWMESADPVLAKRGLRGLAGFQEFNLLCLEPVRASVQRVRASDRAQTELYQGELSAIEARLNGVQAALAGERGGPQVQAGWLATVIEAAEKFLDAGDAVRRRRTADRIYLDLASQRISHARASLELQKLNARQKGGWLLKRFEAGRKVAREGDAATVDAAVLND